MRTRVLFAFCCLILLTLLGACLSIVRIREVQWAVHDMSQVVTPLNREWIKMKQDTDILKKEIDKNFGSQHWLQRTADPHWVVQEIPVWVFEVLIAESQKVAQYLGSSRQLEFSQELKAWPKKSVQQLQDIRQLSDKIFLQLSSHSFQEARTTLLALNEKTEAWQRSLTWGSHETERNLNTSFEKTEDHVSSLQIGLEVVISVIALFSILFIWFVDQALKPLSQVTSLARQIKDRGLLKQEDKSLLPDIALRDEGEVSQLVREFHSMAATLLEREKLVESQKMSLEAQNIELRSLNELKEKLKQAEQLAMVGRMSAQIAHEIRNPLHAIGLEAEMALSLTQETSELQELQEVKQSSLAIQQQQKIKFQLQENIRAILASVDRLQLLTENYLKLSKGIEAGQGYLNHSSDMPRSNARPVYHLQFVLEKALATYSSDFQKFHIQVDWKTETDSWVQGDAEWMEQALGNLIKNSIQALESVDRERRLIRILLGHTETGKVWIQFRDHGPGLTTEIKNQLFKPFFTTKSEGTGLGLSFVKHVFEQQGGQFDVMMPVQGQFEGACFQGFLPLAAQETVKNIQTLVERNSERDSERNSLL